VSRPVRILLRILYWVAVVVISIALLVGLIMLFESRDESEIEDGSRLAPLAPAGRI
jgi:hypothetical protein